jgi:hypothetical protein
MPTLLKEGGFRFLIYFNDHDPAHVHVHGSGAAKIILEGPESRPIPDRATMSAGDLKKALKIVGDHQEEFLQRWREIHD